MGKLLPYADIRLSEELEQRLFSALGSFLTKFGTERLGRAASLEDEIALLNSLAVGIDSMLINLGVHIATHPTEVSITCTRGHPNINAATHDDAILVRQTTRYGTRVEKMVCPYCNAKMDP